MAYDALFRKLKEKGLGQGQLASAVCVRDATVSGWKRGVHVMSLDMALQIRDTVFPECTLDELFRTGK